MSGTGARCGGCGSRATRPAGGFFVRMPVEGELLEALDEGRLTIGDGTLLEPGCWLTLAPEARIEIGSGCFLNRNTMFAALELIEVGDHVMFANGCFVGDADHRFDDPDIPIPWQGFTSKGPVRIGANCWFGVNCVVTSGVTIGERCVIGANSVVTGDLAPGTIAAGAPAREVGRFAGAERCISVAAGIRHRAGTTGTYNFPSGRDPKGMDPYGPDDQQSRSAQEASSSPAARASFAMRSPTRARGALDRPGADDGLPARRARLAAARRRAPGATSSS